MRSDTPKLDARDRPRRSWRPTRTRSDLGRRRRLPGQRRGRRPDRPRRPERHVRGAGRPGRPDRSRGLADRLAHPPAAGLRLRRAAPRHGLGPGHRHRRDRRRRRPHARGAGTRPRSRSSSTRSAPSGKSRALLRCAVGRARDAGQAQAVVRVPDPADDPPAVPDRDDRAGRAGHPDRRAPRVVRPAIAALLTVIGACFVQLGLNVANDVFDTVQGADDANVTPTQFSGGSRVIQYGLVCLRQMATLATVFYVLAGLIGLDPAGDARLDRAARHRRRRVHRQPRLHGAAAEVRLSRARRDRRRARVRAADAARGVRRPDRRRARLGAVRGVDPGRPARRADPVRQRDPRPARRRPGRQADAPGPVLARRRSSPATTSRPRRRTSCSWRASSSGILPIPRC